MSTDDLPAETMAETMIDRYRLLECIGAGGFGAVYRVEDTVTGRPAALKILHPELAGMGEPLVRLLREARLLEQVRHPNVVEVLATGTLPGGRAYFAMEHLLGEDLDAHLRAHGRMAPREVLAILTPLCAALAHAHAQGIVHRDIKASNIFLEERGGCRRVVLLDFGIAKMAEAVGDGLTGPQVAVGTPTSMSPEQILGAPADARTDVYLLGVLAFQMLTGALPFPEASRGAAMRMHTEAPRPRPSDRGAVGSELDEVVTRAMSRAASARYPSVQDFLNAFRRAAGGHAEERQTKTQRAVAIVVSASADDDALDDADGAVLADMEEVLGCATRQLLARDFLPALESGDAVVFVRPVQDDEVEALRVRREAVVAAVGLEQVLARRVGRHEHLHVQVSLRLGEITLEEGWVRGGDWLGGGDEVRCTGGLVGTRDVFAGLGVTVAPVPGAPHLQRVVALADGSGEERARASHTETMAQLGRMLVGIVHELRAPLAVVSGNLTLVQNTLRTGSGLTDLDRHSVADALSGADQAVRMVTEILRVSAIRGHAADQREEVSVSELIDSALTIARAEVLPKAKVVVHCAPACRVRVSRTRVTQVLTNLLVNAAQAMPRYGLIEVHATQVGDLVRIAVRDDGAGMDAALQQRIFDPFFTTKPAGTGTGVGLALARTIVTEQGGTIGVTSSPDEGSCFTLELPGASV